MINEIVEWIIGLEIVQRITNLIFYLLEVIISPVIGPVGALPDFYAKIINLPWRILEAITQII